MKKISSLLCGVALVGASVGVNAQSNDVNLGLSYTPEKVTYETMSTGNVLVKSMSANGLTRTKEIKDPTGKLISRVEFFYDNQGRVIQVNQCATNSGTIATPKWDDYTRIYWSYLNDNTPIKEMKYKVIYNLNNELVESFLNGWWDKDNSFANLSGYDTPTMVWDEATDQWKNSNAQVSHLFIKTTGGWINKKSFEFDYTIGNTVYKLSKNGNAFYADNAKVVTASPESATEGVTIVSVEKFKCALPSISCVDPTKINTVIKELIDANCSNYSKTWTEEKMIAGQKRIIKEIKYDSNNFNPKNEYLKNWDDKGRQIFEATNVWNGSEWAFGSKQETVYDDNNGFKSVIVYEGGAAIRKTLTKTSLSLPENEYKEVWTYSSDQQTLSKVVTSFPQTPNDKARCKVVTTYSDLVWNPSTSEFVESLSKPTTQKVETYNQAFSGSNSSTIEKTENFTWKTINNSTKYYSDGNIISGGVITRYDSFGNLIYKCEEDASYVSKYIVHKNEFTDNNKLISSVVFYSNDGINLISGINKEEYTYDNAKVTEVHWEWDGTSGQGWKMVSKTVKTTVGSSITTDTYGLHATTNSWVLKKREIIDTSAGKIIIEQYNPLSNGQVEFASRVTKIKLADTLEEISETVGAVPYKTRLKTETKNSERTLLSESYDRNGLLMSKDNREYKDESGGSLLKSREVYPAVNGIGKYLYEWDSNGALKKETLYAKWDGTGIISVLEFSPAVAVAANQGQGTGSYFNGQLSNQPEGTCYQRYTSNQLSSEAKKNFEEKRDGIVYTVNSDETTNSFRIVKSETYTTGSGLFCEIYYKQKAFRNWEKDYCVENRKKGIDTYDHYLVLNSEGKIIHKENKTLAIDQLSNNRPLKELIPLNTGGTLDIDDQRQGSEYLIESNELGYKIYVYRPNAADKFYEIGQKDVIDNIAYTYFGYSILQKEGKQIWMPEYRKVEKSIYDNGYMIEKWNGSSYVLFDNNVSSLTITKDLSTSTSTTKKIYKLIRYDNVNIKANGDWCLSTLEQDPGLAIYDNYYVDNVTTEVRLVNSPSHCYSYPLISANEHASAVFNLDNIVVDSKTAKRKVSYGNIDQTYYNSSYEYSGYKIVNENNTIYPQTYDAQGNLKNVSSFSNADINISNKFEKIITPNKVVERMYIWNVDKNNWDTYREYSSTTTVDALAGTLAIDKVLKPDQSAVVTLSIPNPELEAFVREASVTWSLVDFDNDEGEELVDDDFDYDFTFGDFISISNNQNDPLKANLSLKSELNGYLFLNIAPKVTVVAKYKNSTSDIQYELARITIDVETLTEVKGDLTHDGKVDLEDLDMFADDYINNKLSIKHGRFANVSGSTAQGHELLDFYAIIDIIVPSTPYAASLNAATNEVSLAVVNGVLESKSNTGIKIFDIKYRGSMDIAENAIPGFVLQPYVDANGDTRLLGYSLNSAINSGINKLFTVKDFEIISAEFVSTNGELMTLGSGIISSEDLLADGVVVSVSNKILTVSSSETASSIEVVSVDGKSLVKVVDTNQVNLSDFGTGSYIVKIKFADSELTKKVLVK